MFSASNLILFSFACLLLRVVSDSSSDEDESRTKSIAELFMQEIKDFNVANRKFKNDLKILKTDKKTIQGSMPKTDVIRLNVGGEQMMTTRASLTVVSTSLLAKLFSRRWEEKLVNDQDGNVFLDFNPTLFRHLLEQLRTLKNTDQQTQFSPPHASSPLMIRSFNKMLKTLDLQLHQKQLNNKVIVMNVGGDCMITRENTLKGANSNELIPNSIETKIEGAGKRSSLFVDTDSRLFSSLIENLRHVQHSSSMRLASSTPAKKIKAFERMLKNLKLTEMTPAIKITRPIEIPNASTYSCSFDDWRSIPLKTITFNTGESTYSNQTPSDFGFSTTYLQATNGIPGGGYFSFIKTVPANGIYWHTGAVDLLQAPSTTHGYMFLININFGGGEFFRANVVGLTIGCRYYFSVYFANFVRKRLALNLPDVLLQVRTVDEANILLGETKTGPIPEENVMTWRKYGIGFLAHSTSVKLMMISNASGAGGNDLAMDNIEIRGCI